MAFAVSAIAASPYSSSYSEALKRFREAGAEVQARFPKAELGRLPLTQDPNLAIDFIYVPAADTRSLVIVTSGVHGAEAYTGSALQLDLLKNQMGRMQALKLGLLVIHAVNPYGFKNFRRTTRENVDLNRNFSTNSQLYATQNFPYSELNTLLNPEEPVNLRGRLALSFVPRLLSLNLQRGRGFLTEAIAGGQFEFPQGLYFGGKEAAENVSLVSKLLTHYAQKYERVLALDIHTGYGKRGRLHYLGSSDPKALEKAKPFFTDRPLEGSGHEGFYRTTGDFIDFIPALLPDKEGAGVTLEFGTRNSQTTWGALRSLMALVFENEGFHYGYASPAMKEKVEREYRELFYPSSRLWRAQVLDEWHVSLPRILERFSEGGCDRALAL